MRLKTTVILVFIAAGFSLLNLAGEWQRQAELEKSAYAGLLIPIPLKEVQSFRIDFGAGAKPVECKKIEKHWRLLSPVNDLADHYAVEEVLALVSYGRAKKTADISMADAGLRASGVSLTVRGLESREKIFFGKPTPEDNGIYVRAESQPGKVYRLDQDLAAFLKRKPEEFRALDLFPGKADQVEKIILEGTPEAGKDGRIEFDRVPKGWMLRYPGTWPADGEKVERLLKRYAELRAKKVLAEDPGAAAAFGFTRGNSVGLQVITSRGESESVVLAPPPEKGGNGAAIVVGRQAIFAVADGLRSLIAANPAANYRQRRLEPLAGVGGVAEVRIEASGSLLRLCRNGDNWFGETPKKFSVDINELNKLVQEIENLTASRFISDSAEASRDYGLKHPSLRLRITDLGGKECVNLSIGKKTNKNEYYAALAGRPEIFTLPDKIARFLARPWYVYHNRQIAYFTDLRQALTLSIWLEGKDPQGPPSVRYKRLQGHAWQMMLPQTLPADAEALYRGVLSDKGLADLRAVKFVGTAAAGLAKFGLDPPRLRVVVTYLLSPAKDSRKPVFCDLEIGDPVNEYYYARSKFLDEDLVFLIHKSLVKMLRADYVDRELLK